MDGKLIGLLCFIFVKNITSIENGSKAQNDDNIILKKLQSEQIIGSVQLGIQHAMNHFVINSESDLIMPDFIKIEEVSFPSNGTENTPSHNFPEFTFKTYAPYIFQYFRKIYKIKSNNFEESFCSSPLRQLSNPGASGSLFYVTHDDKFIMKSVQKKESRFLQTLLNGYYFNLKQNPSTLLPKFYSLYRYTCTSNYIWANPITGKNKKNIRLIAMNNLLPSSIKIHQKFDLKGSTFKRTASEHERLKSLPTFKDQDFQKLYPNGIYLKPDVYESLMSTLQRDCDVLESFNIMDYSLLMGVHNIDLSLREKGIESEVESPIDVENIALPKGSIQAMSSDNDRLVLFIGIIDILQQYDFRKKLEHKYKAIIYDSDTVSVHRPQFYSSRFMEFMSENVFKIGMYPPAENATSNKRINSSSSLQDEVAKIGLTIVGKIKKLGHRRVGNDGIVTYKKITTVQIMGSVQLGIKQAVEHLDFEIGRNLLITDFSNYKAVLFPSKGSDLTPPHTFPEYSFKSYAPVIFYHFRSLYKVEPSDFLRSYSSSPLRELSNPGASGSVFFMTQDDKYIIKTVKKDEGKFLQKILNGYYLNLDQNPDTRLPKFFGLYRYKCSSKYKWVNYITRKDKKKIRLVVMNNLIPSNIEIHQKYDLKGSTYERKASKREREKSLPTLKDIDFKDNFKNGIYLEPDTYSKLLDTLRRDCRFLLSFNIMDYSLLLGIHFVNHTQKTNQDPSDQESNNAGNEKNSISPIGIPAFTVDGKKLLLFIGIIDILQNYGFAKKTEHTYKSVVQDGETVSVIRPDFYEIRFLEFMTIFVFKKLLSPINSSSNKAVSKMQSYIDSQKKKWLEQANKPWIEDE